MLHDVFMEQALNLAKKGKWSTGTNPCVGAVLTCKGKVIAEGYHTAYGKAHAEIECLLDAIHQGIFLGIELEFSNPVLASAHDEKNKSNNGFTPYALSDCILYVTLEPCKHEGKTPPCTQAIIESGIKHVVIGMLDPNPKASGGIEILEKHGIRIETGILENACKDLIDNFIVWQQQRPYVILKMATSLDGRIGPNSGHNHRISGAESHEILMQLRENIGNAGGAVLVGANTFLQDNPKLTARTKTAKKQPYAVIVGSKLPLLAANETIFACLEERAHEVLFYCSMEQEVSQAAHALREKGVFVKGVSYNQKTQKDYGLNLKEILGHLYREKACPYVLCEGGARLGLSLLEEGLVDELILYMAPIIMGDETSKAVFLGHSMDKMADAIRFNIKETILVGSDLHIHLKPERVCLQG